MNATIVTAPSGNTRLVVPVSGMGPAYHAFLNEFIAAGEEGLLHNLPEENEDPAECIRRLKEHKEGYADMSEDWVDCSAFWLLSGEEMLLGEVHIRHRLTPSLEDYGGNIGYMVRPGQRCRGHATRMLGMALEKAREMGMKRVLLTCEPENLASARVILKNGGRLISESVARTGRLTSRYWIDL